MSSRFPQRRADCYTSHEVSRICGVAPITVGRWIEAGKLKAFRTVGGHRRIMKNDLQTFLDDMHIPVSPLPQGDERKVIVVDDDEVMFNVLREMMTLVRGEWRVEWAANGFEAGRMVEAFKPHLVFLDLMMPGLDGFEVCSRIKSDPGASLCEIVGITGFFTPENRDRMIERGALDLLRKPVDFETLHKVLSRVFEIEA